MANLSIKTGTISRSMLVGNSPFIPGAFESIATLTGNGSAASVVFNSIPSTYKHLQLRMVVRDGSSANSQYQLWFNGGASASYASHVLRGSDTTPSSAAFFTNTEMRFAAFTSQTTANVFGASIVDIIDYANTSKNKTVRAFAGYDNNTSNGWNYLTSSVWLSTLAINSITIYNANNSALAVGSTFSLYGIKGE